MNVLVLGLYAEGSTDYSFLTRVIQRTAEQLLADHEQNAEVLVLEMAKNQEKDRAKSILQAARDACGYHALIVHSDADHPTPEKAFQERFQLGYKMVQRSKEVPSYQQFVQDLTDTLIALNILPRIHRF